MYLGQRKDDLTVTDRRGSSQRGDPGCINAFESWPAQPTGRVLMIEQVDKPVLLLEVLLQAANQLRNVLRRRRNASCRITCQQQIVGEHDPISTGHRADFMLTVGVERDEGKHLVEGAVRRPHIGVFNDQCSATRGTRQRHGQRAHHGVTLLGVLVGKEKLAWGVDEHRMQLRLQGAVIRQPQVAAESGKYRLQGPVPPPLIDPHLAFGYLPSTADPGIGERLLPLSVPCRTGYATQLLGLRGGHRNFQRSDACNVDAQIPRRPCPPSTECATPARRTE